MRWRADFKFADLVFENGGMVICSLQAVQNGIAVVARVDVFGFAM